MPDLFRIFRIPMMRARARDLVGNGAYEEAILLIESFGVRGDEILDRLLDEARRERARTISDDARRCRELGFLDEEEKFLRDALRAGWDKVETLARQADSAAGHIRALIEARQMKEAGEALQRAKAQFGRHLGLIRLESEMKEVEWKELTGHLELRLKERNYDEAVRIIRRMEKQNVEGLLTAFEQVPELAEARRKYLEDHLKRADAVFERGDLDDGQKAKLVFEEIRLIEDVNPHCGGLGILRERANRLRRKVTPERGKPLSAVFDVQVQGDVREYRVFTQPEVALGCLAENDICLRGLLSRRQAVFRRRDAGFEVENLSVNFPMLVNGEPATRRILRGGEKLQFGAALEFEFIDTTYKNSPSARLKVIRGAMENHGYVLMESCASIGRGRNDALYILPIGGEPLLEAHALLEWRDGKVKVLACNGDVGYANRLCPPEGLVLRDDDEISLGGVELIMAAASERM